MTADKQFKDVTKEEEKKYVLCYIDSVPHTYTDLDPRSKELSETTEYKEYAAKKKAYFDEILKREHSYSSTMISEYNRNNDPFGKYTLDYCEYPHPDYAAGYTHYFYFTDNMSKQWGDDWNDAPYDCNAEEPYDSETNIIRIPVRLTYYVMEHLISNWEVESDLAEDSDKFNKLLKKYLNYNKCQLKFPKDYGYNSPFCVDDINHGAVAWLYFALYDYSVKESVAIYGGDSIKVVKKKLNHIEKILKTKPDKE